MSHISPRAASDPNRPGTMPADFRAVFGERRHNMAVFCDERGRWTDVAKEEKKKKKKRKKREKGT